MASWQRRRASMRPRPEGRGERQSHRSFSMKEGGFNAATTRRPWRTMGHRRQPCSHAPDRFNAATTRRPWRTLPFFLYTPNTNELQCGHDPKAVENFSECVRDAKGHCASMRPRPEGRGEPQDRLEQVLHFRLQCGHDPKAVENEAYHHEEGAGTVMLQCGHDPKAVENHGPSVPATPDPRFNAATTRRPWRTSPVHPRRRLCRNASMRPRPEGRGELPSGAAALPASVRLQCGHDPKAVENADVRRDYGRLFPCFNAATTRRPWRTSGEHVCWWEGDTLQCGHDPKAVENVSSTATPWGEVWLQCGHDPKAVENAGIDPVLTEPSQELQCGHDPKAVENSAADLTHALVSMASMRPRPEGRGELPGGNNGFSAGRRFNAATTRRPWRTRRSVPCAYQRDRASMRPRPEGRGEPREAQAIADAIRSRFNAATTRRPWRTRSARG